MKKPKVKLRRWERLLKLQRGRYLSTAQQSDMMRDHRVPGWTTTSKVRSEASVIGGWTWKTRRSDGVTYYRPVWMA